MKFLSLFTALCILSHGMLSTAETGLNLLSLNVYMLPKPIKWTLQEERTIAITEQLRNSNYDFIFLQEAFMSDFRKNISEKLKQEYPYSYYLERDTKWFHFMGSGVFILSRYPIQVLGKLYFDDCASFDCLASKGAFLFESKLPNGKTFQFATSHLQAGREHGKLRMKQLEQIRLLLEKNFKKDVPQLLVGDLNINFPDSEFKQGLELLNMNYASLVGEIKTTSARSTDCYDTPTIQMWIDHVWMDKNLEVENPEIAVKDFSFKYHGNLCPSSDHHGVVAYFKQGQQQTHEAKLHWLPAKAANKKSQN